MSGTAYDPATVDNDPCRPDARTGQDIGTDVPAAAGVVGQETL